MQSAAVRAYIKNDVVPIVLARVSDLLSTTRVAGNLYFGTRPCTSIWPNLGECASVTTSPTCGSLVAVPDAHLLPTTLCLDGIRDNCEVIPGGSGVANADVILYFAAKPAASCDLGAAAFASSCSLDDATDRPIAGYVNICAPLLVVRGAEDYAHRVHDIQMVLHEVTHVLGFSRYLYKFWRDTNGNPRTPRDENGVPTEDPATTTVRQFTEGGAIRSKVVTPAVVQAVRSHFGCASANGGEPTQG